MRVEKHRESRRASDWETIEETVDLAGAIRRARTYRVLLVDCLTLWVNNLLYEAEGRGEVFTEEATAVRCREVIDACGAFPGTIIFVTNELGMGIVPDNETARRFRDCAGRCNQMIAEAAGTVILVVSGIPLQLKPEREGRHSVMFRSTVHRTCHPRRSRSSSHPEAKGFPLLRE